MSNPIGIFDSGIGGCTVAHAISQILPQEQLLYFGDTLHLPYGDKSAQSIGQYCEKITHFLIEKKAKMIVIACNTASAVAYEVVSKITRAKNIPLIDVIGPITQEVALSPYQAIGILGTRATIGSKVYEQKIHKINPRQKIQALASPLLVPIVEEGLAEHTLGQAAVNYYLDQLKNIEALVLGCTHYPLLLKAIQRQNQKIKIFDGASTVAQKVKKVLEENQLLSVSKEKENQFFVSELTPNFQKNAALFFGEKINLEMIQL